LKNQSKLLKVGYIAFRIKILGALSLGDVRKKSTIPFLLPAQSYYLETYGLQITDNGYPIACIFTGFSKARV
jgi:hypothetical protein